MTAQEIVSHFGGKSKAARAIGITLQTLRNWKKSGIPMRSQKWIQFETGGALKARK